MKAALLTEHNQPLRVDWVELTPLTYGQVQVRILASGICGAQLQEIRGDKAANTPMPRLLGHEACGMVEEIGPGVTKLKRGDKVVAHWRVGEGLESDFPRYLYAGKEITSGKIATFAERAIISENRLTSVPQDTPRELCALLGCGLSTALGTIENEAELRFGESILIIGCGGLGANLILSAKVRGAGTIAATDIHAGKESLALAMGADYFATAHTLMSGPTKVRQMFDVIIDTTGSTTAMETHLPLLNSGGRFIMVGQQRAGEHVSMHNANHMFAGEGKTIRATQGGKFNPSKDVPRYLELWKAGRLKIDGLISHRLGLEDINEGIELVRAGLAGRVLIET